MKSSGLRLPRRRQTSSGGSPGLPGIARHQDYPTRALPRLLLRRSRSGASAIANRSSWRTSWREPGWEVFPGSVAWVRELREAGLKTGCGVEQPQLCRGPGARRESPTFSTPARRRHRSRARPAGEACAGRLSRGCPAPRRVPPADRRRGGRARRRRGREGRRVRAGGGRGSGRTGGGAGGARRPPRRRRPRGTVGRLERSRSPHGSRAAIGSSGGPSASSRRPGTTRPTRGGWSSAPTTLPYVEQTETLFALSNGYLGMRGSFDEGEPASRPGTLLNGFHETWPIVYPEAAYGFATTGQTILPVPDGSTIRLFVDEDPVTCVTAEVLEYERAVDMRRGALERDGRVSADGGSSAPRPQPTPRVPRPTPSGLHPLRGDSHRAPVRVVISSELKHAAGRRRRTAAGTPVTAVNSARGPFCPTSSGSTACG